MAAQRFDITPEEVAEEVRKLAGERPEFVYRGIEDVECSYVTGADGVGCIIGQAVQRLGVPEATLADAERDSAINVAELLFKLTGVRRPSYDGGVMNFLTQVQGRQDEGIPWGQAVRHASFMAGTRG